MTATTVDSPVLATDWLARAREVAEVLAGDAAERDAAGRTPVAEVRLLKESGLVTLLGSRAAGGGGQDWSTALDVVRTVSRADGSVGQLLGYHYLWFWAARFFGTEGQIRLLEEEAIRGTLFYSGALNPRDKDMAAVDRGDSLVINGRKSFASGSGLSDRTFLGAALPDGRPAFVIAESTAPGLVYHHDWDNMGQRLTESGTITVTDLEVPWTAALGFVDKELVSSVYSSLSILTLQQIMANLYQGIAEGALSAAAGYTRTQTRPWPYGGDPKDSACEEWYVLEHYGDFQSRLWATGALVESTNAALSDALHDPRPAMTPQRRGELAVRISAAKQRTIIEGLDVCTRMFDVMGARATSGKYRFDRFWRNLRTHSLHDPVAYKKREVGQYALMGQLPRPTFYS
ncbi:acyl-CoA dehydrogenase family protein [Blastococcus montanus]|uniref:acyl-CoA dehydrogenase family protein n=1 Tax=Blastococcus montanus TaxID=3144973 RepID=UPI00320791CC